MIGLLTEKNSYIARTDIPLIVEPSSIYLNKAASIPEEFISISTKFCDLTGGQSIENMIPVYPNEIVKLLALENGEDDFAYLMHRDHEGFTQGIHIKKLCKKISNYYRSLYNYNDQSVRVHFLVLIRNHAIFFRSGSLRIEFFHIYEWQTSTELLFHINKKFVDDRCDYEKDELIILGEVEMKAEIYSLFQKYFKNIITDDYNPLKFIESI